MGINIKCLSLLFTKQTDSTMINYAYIIQVLVIELILGTWLFWQQIIDQELSIEERT